MKKYLVMLIFGIFLFGFINLASAQTETSYYIYEKKVLVKHNFNSVYDLDLRIPLDAGKLEVNVDYVLETFEDYRVIKIESDEEVSISYITESMIDKSGKKFYFVSRNYLNESQNIRLILPESAVLVENGFVFPEPNLISSDGRSIILGWNNFNGGQILVDYEFVESNNLVYYLVFILLILIFSGYVLFEKKRHKKKLKEARGKKKKKTTEENLTKNLFEDEKKIVEYLMKRKKNEAWTKEILRDLGITKVKLSRKLRSLEQKELIKKIPYGNENKVGLVRKRQ